MESILKDIFTTLYSDLFQALVFAITMSMLMYFLRKEKVKIKEVLIKWKKHLISKKEYIFEFLLFVYFYLMLSRTLFARKMIYDGLGDLWGGWTISVGKRGNIVYEAAENIILFIPFTLLILLAGKIKHKSIMGRLAKCATVCLVLSLYIEINQVIFSLGTLQFSDMVYNLVGGIIGVVIFLLLEKLGYSTKWWTS